MENERSQQQLRIGILESENKRLRDQGYISQKQVQQSSDIQIAIESPNGKEIQVQMGQSETLAEIQQKIEKQTGIKAEHICLYYKNNYYYKYSKETVKGLGVQNGEKMVMDEYSSIYYDFDYAQFVERIREEHGEQYLDLLESWGLWSTWAV